jgi:hypothetical protein
MFSLCSKGATMTIVANILTDQALELRETLLSCIHETGHTIAARHCGFQVAWVSIDPNFVVNDPLARRSGIMFGYPTSMVIVADRINPILRRGHTRSPEERQLVESYLMETLAGPIAEELFNEAFDPELSASDYQQAGLVIGCLATEKSARRSMIRRANQNAQDFVARHKDVIMNFACQLFNARTLRAADIDRAISIASLEARGRA